MPDLCQGFASFNLIHNGAGRYSFALLFVCLFVWVGGGGGEGGEGEERVSVKRGLRGNIRNA